MDMRKALFLVLLVFPFQIAAQHIVTAGTENNQLVLAVRNASHATIRDVQVAVHSAPEWVVFTTTSVVIDSIPSQTWGEATFEFRIADPVNYQKATISLAIRDDHGNFLGTRLITLRAVALPQKTELLPPFPNPANPGATIQYTLRASSHVKLEIYNLLGQRVRMLLNEEKPAGTLMIDWDGRNDKGLPLSSGTYLVHLRIREKGKNQEEQFSSKITIRK
jgi:hypothetical protein